MKAYILSYLVSFFSPSSSILKYALAASCFIIILSFDTTACAVDEESLNQPRNNKHRENTDGCMLMRSVVKLSCLLKMLAFYFVTPVLPTLSFRNVWACCCNEAWAEDWREDDVRYSETLQIGLILTYVTYEIHPWSHQIPMQLSMG